jgi:type I restriction enzyme S subunit
MSAAPKVDWRPFKLDELGFVGRGKSRHRPRDAEFLYGGPYPFIQTGDVKVADLYITSYSQTYSEAGLAQSKLWDPDTLLITIAANIAETAILKMPACFPDSIVGFTANPAKADVRFVKYYIDTIKLGMQNVSHGATQDNLSLDKLLRFEFLTPPPPVQRRIVSILGAYDDLIENNLRRIKVLEQMAQAIYREWFIEFRAPGVQLRKATPEEKKVTGKDKIPRNWEITLLGGNAKLSREGIDPGRFPKETFEYYSFQAFDEGRLPTLVGGSEIMSGKFVIPQECVLVSKLNPKIPRVWLPFVGNDHRAICSSEFLVLEAVEPWTRTALFSQLSSSEFLSVFASQALGTSTSHQRARPDSFMRLPVLKPPPALLAEFTSLAEPMLAEVNELRSKNVNLRRTRDLLLPRLVSGETEIA